MALNLGLILGSALAGAAAGGGDAAEKLGQEEQKQQGQQDLVRMQSQLDEQKQMRIQEAEHNFQNQYQGQAFAHEDTSQAAGFTQTSKENALNRASEESRSAGNNATSIAVANIGANATLSAEAMRVNAQKEIQKLANKGITLVQNKDGAYVSVDKTTGATTPILVDGQPLIGQKNVDSATAMAAASLLKADPDDSPDQTKQKQKMAYSMLGIDPQKGNYPRPTKAAIDALTKNPASSSQFERTFGPGSAQVALGGGTAPAPAGGAAAPMPGGGDPGAGTNNPALINGQIPTQPMPVAATAPQPVTGAMPSPDQQIAASNAALAQRGTARPVAAAPAVAPYQPSALIASQMTPQQGPPPTQPAFRQQLDAFGRPIPLNTVQNQLGL